MGWRVYADTYNNDSELGTKSCKVKFGKNIILQYSPTWIIFYNDPPVTSLKMEIYSDNDGSIGSLLHTSTNQPTKSQMISLENGIKHISFLWNNIQLDGVNWYHFVLNGTTSGLSASSTIAWKHSFPDPVYRTGLALSLEELQVTPYDIYFIGAEL